MFNFVPVSKRKVLINQFTDPSLAGKRSRNIFRKIVEFICNLFLYIYWKICVFFGKFEDFAAFS